MMRCAGLLAFCSMFVLAACTGAISGPGTLDPWGGTDGNALGGGRLPRRLSADQIRAAYEELTGFPFEGRAVVRDATSPYGLRTRDDADLLDVYAQALGRPDYAYTVKENLEPSVSFSKLVGDAARSTCGRTAQAEVVEGSPPGGKPRLLLRATAGDDWPQSEDAIRRNISALVQRFWGRDLDSASEDVSALVEVFRTAREAEPSNGDQARGGAVSDGWRAVCIALATDPAFYVY